MTVDPKAHRAPDNNALEPASRSLPLSARGSMRGGLK